DEVPDECRRLPRDVVVRVGRAVALLPTGDPGTHGLLSFAVACREKLWRVSRHPPGLVASSAARYDPRPELHLSQRARCGAATSPFATSERTPASLTCRKGRGGRRGGRHSRRVNEGVAHRERYRNPVARGGGVGDPGGM